MIISLEIENFGCFRDRQYISFEAEGSDRLPSHYTKIAGKKILQMAVVIGANASGKTTVLNAISFLFSLVNDPKRFIDEEIDYDTFIFSEDSAKKQSFFSLEFIANKKVYVYSVAIERKRISRESLFRVLEKERVMLYDRQSFEENNELEISFGSEIFSFYREEKKSELQFLQYQTLPNNTILSSYRTVNIGVPDFINDILLFFYRFKEKMDVSVINVRTAQKYFETYPSLKEYILKFMKRADFGLHNVSIKTSESSSSDVIDYVSKGGELIEYRLKEDAPKFLKKKFWSFTREIDGKLYEISLDKESEGTKRFLTLAMYLSVNVLSGGILLIDELDSSLHPELFNLMMFMMNIENSLCQFIFTTHNFTFLQDKDTYRYDNVLIVEKKQDLSSEIYRLSDFGEDELDRITDIYRSYLFGRFGGKPIVSYPYQKNSRNEEE